MVGRVSEASACRTRQMFEGRMERRTLDLYGRRDRVRMAQTLGRWHRALDRPLCVVAVDPLTGGRTRQAFYSQVADGIDVLTADHCSACFQNPNENRADFSQQRAARLDSLDRARV